jgi:hypothetical protein
LGHSVENLPAASNVVINPMELQVQDKVGVRTSMQTNQSKPSSTQGQKERNATSEAEGQYQSQQHV